MRNTVLIITPGDPDGIGPEITWSAIQSSWTSSAGTVLVCVGARRPFDRMGAPVIPIRGEVTRSSLLSARHAAGRQPGVLLIEAPEKAETKDASLAGYQSGWSIVRAAELLLRGGVGDALVTGPISKERLQAGGYPFPGHTEFLAALCAAHARKARTPRRVPQFKNSTRGVTQEVTMMLANSQLRVSLVTTHLALKDVPGAVDRKSVKRAILHTAEHLKRDCGVARPRIAVAALNPHAGEAGLFGREEIRVIAPEIRALLQKRPGALKGALLEGPFPADTLFVKKERYDAIVCMYHDQGLIPVKLLDFPRTVNISLGLPIIRTSVDHGVAFDIAGTGKADPSSLLAAIAAAGLIVENRRKQESAS